MGHQPEADRTARLILGRIVDGTYPAGLRLPAEVELAKELACGRSTIREALAELSAMGVVKSRRGSGATVLDFKREATPAILSAYLMAGAPDSDPLVLATELLRIRSLLATEAVRLASLYAPEGALAPAREILARWSPKGPAAEQAVDEIAFFRAIVAASRVWPAIWMANAYFGPMGDVQSLLAPIVGGPPSDYPRSMSRLLDLIEAGDADAAVAFFTAWITRIDKALLGRVTATLKGTPAPRARPPNAGRPSASASKRARNEKPRRPTRAGVEEVAR